MIEHTKSPGPIELQYAQSDDPKLRRLSQMSNLELLGYINELVEADGAFDETMFDAVGQLPKGTEFQIIPYNTKAHHVLGCAFCFNVYQSQMCHSTNTLASHSLPPHGSTIVPLGIGFPRNGGCIACGILRQEKRSKRKNNCIPVALSFI